MTGEFARCVSKSNLCTLDLSMCWDRPANANLSRFLTGLHSCTLETLKLDGILPIYGQATIVAGGQDLIQELQKDCMDVAITIAAFLRSCARAHVLRLALDQPAVEALFFAESSMTRPKTRGCGALQYLTIDHSRFGPGEIDLIEGVWRASFQLLSDDSNRYLAQALAQGLRVNLRRLFALPGIPRLPSKAATSNELTQVYRLSAEMGGDLMLDEAYGAIVQAALSDPIIQKLLRSEPEQDDVDAFGQFQASRGRPHTLLNLAGGEVNTTVRIFQQKEGQPLRAAALQLLAAARILGCRVRHRSEKGKASGEFKGCYWLTMPVEIRRACLEYIPMLSVPTADEIKALVSQVHPSSHYIKTVQDHSLLSRKMVDRVLAFAADRRTIGYGLLPEATFLDLRIASDKAPQTEARILGESPWSFTAARRRWTPLDSRSELDAEVIEASFKLPRAAECFLRSIGLVEDLINLVPRYSEREKSPP